MPDPTIHLFPEGMLTWTLQNPERGPMRDHGFAVLPWQTLLEQFVAPAHAAGAAHRTSLAAPAQPLLDRYAKHPAVAVVDVRLDDLDALRTLHDYVLRPAWQAGCRLLVHADRHLEDLREAQMVEPGFEHGYTLERALHLVAVMCAARGPQPDPGHATPSRPLDTEQLRAVAAGDGVTQIIAPAGSGKTTVLVQRVRELLRRGTPPARILCATFNKAAAEEMRERLAAAGVDGVQARTFHSIGTMILREENLLRGQPRGLSLGQWRRLSTLASKATGTWVDPADAREAIGSIKLVHLATAQEWARRPEANADANRKSVAEIYRLYESDQRHEDYHDYDDQIMLAVRALRSDRAVRERWQHKFQRVLVDEFQDIEPAQELLVQILAAPEDSIFAVGDEDQTLYGWRRASVQRIVGLDQAYPSLQRVALATNYRCPVEVVERSAQLISCNELRFPKTIGAAPGKAPSPSSVSLDEFASPEQAADWAAGQLARSCRGQIVVLARTSRLLRIVALACIEPQVRISAPPAVFEARGSQAAVDAHLRLAVDRLDAQPEDVALVLRSPPRGLALGAEETVAGRLRAGADWRRALAGQGRDETKLTEAADLLNRLGDLTDAVKFMRTLRGPFGLDRHFEEHEKTFGGAEQTETEALVDAEKQAKGKTVHAFATMLAGHRNALLALRDDEHGVELATVHGAKGREWPTVIVFRMDDGQLPHKKALDVTPAQRAAGEGIEAERRVAYVALTRAMGHLHVLATKGKLSPFAWQAGLAEEPEPPPAAGRPADGGYTTRREGRSPSGSTPRASEDPREKIRDAPSHQAGLTLAASAVAGELGDVSRIALIDLLIEAPAMSSVRVREYLQSSGVQPGVKVGALSATQRRGVVQALRRAARTG